MAHLLKVRAHSPVISNRANGHHLNYRPSDPTRQDENAAIAQNPFSGFLGDFPCIRASSGGIMLWMQQARAGHPPRGMSIMSTEPIQIRRYPNRRFYDRSRSCYITLGDIEELVLEGRSIVVQDSRTGED